MYLIIILKGEAVEKIKIDTYMLVYSTHNEKTTIALINDLKQSYWISIISFNFIDRGR